MAKANRPGVGKASGPVGYGVKGNAFHSVKAFNASKAGHATPQSAQNQALAGKRRAISQAQEHQGPSPLGMSAGQKAHAMTAEASKPIPRVGMHPASAPKRIV